MADAGLRGRFVWYELHTTDPKAAKAFYTEIIGWSTKKFEGPMDYTMWTLRDGTGVGGLMELSAEARKMGAPPHWLAYIGTPETDTTVNKAKSLGAKVLVPAMDIPTVGRFAVLQDPQGAVFAPFTPQPGGDEPTKKEEPALGEFSWHELATTDQVKAFAFYETLFGWEKQDAMDMGPQGVYQMYGQKGKMYGGIYNKPKEMPAPPHWLLYTMVDSVARVAEVVKQKGGKVLNGPMEVPGGSYIAQCMDPQGAAFAIHSKGK